MSRVRIFTRSLSLISKGCRRTQLRLYKKNGSSLRLSIHFLRAEPKLTLMLKSSSVLPCFFLPLGLQAQENWGSISGPLLVQPLDNGRDIQLLADFSTTRSQRLVWLAPKGLVSEVHDSEGVLGALLAGRSTTNTRDAAVMS